MTWKYWDEWENPDVGWHPSGAGATCTVFWLGHLQVCVGGVQQSQSSVIHTIYALCMISVNTDLLSMHTCISAWVQPLLAAAPGLLWWVTQRSAQPTIPSCLVNGQTGHFYNKTVSPILIGLAVCSVELLLLRRPADILTLTFFWFSFSEESNPSIQRELWALYRDMEPGLCEAGQMPTDMLCLSVVNLVYSAGSKHRQEWWRGVVGSSIYRWVFSASASQHNPVYVVSEDPQLYMSGTV